MLKNKKIDDIPEHFASIEEASDFWDTHDAGDYEKYLCPVNEGLDVAKKLPQAVLLEYSLLEKLKKIARQRGTKMYYNNFDEVWRDLREVASQKEKIRTLTQQVPNRIVSVTDSSITVVSERGSGGKRELTRQRFEDFWSKLSEQKSLNFMKDIPESLYRPVGAIIIAFLAHLPCVEYTIKPRVLYLMENATHDLGTTQEMY